MHTEFRDIIENMKKVAMLRAAAAYDGFPVEASTAEDCYAGMKEVISCLDDASKALKADVEILQARLLDAWSEEGVTSKKLAQGRTLYLHRQLWPSRGEASAGEVCSALKAHGYGELVTESYNAQSFASFVREKVKESQDSNPDLSPTEALPDWLRATGLTVTSKTDIRSKKS